MTLRWAIGRTIKPRASHASDTRLEMLASGERSVISTIILNWLNSRVYFGPVLGRAVAGRLLP